MSKRPQKNGSDSAASGNGKRRRNLRAPKAVTIRLCTCLDPNDRHPLAELDPTVREAERQKLLASILARMASGPIQSSHQTDKIEEQ